MWTMFKRYGVQLLLRAGVAQAEITRVTGVSERAIRRIRDEPPVETTDDQAARQARAIGRPSKAEAFRPLVEKLLEAEPELRSVEILRRARLDGYAGGKSALYELVASVRPKAVRPMARFEGLPGEFTQHDFGEVRVRFLDGSERRVQFFATRMKYSRWVEVTLVDDQGVETLVRGLVDHFAAIGGVPLCAVFDRPKTVALKWRKDGVVTEWNPVLGAVLLELGVAPEACWPYRANQKGAVENLVGWVKGSFFKQRRFLDMEDLRRQLREWLDEVNTVRPSRATGVPPAARMTEEHPRLRPLKVEPSELALRVPVFVGPTGVVLHDGHVYSMPAGAIGIAGTLFLHRDRVRIVAGRFESSHARLFEPGAKSILPEHRAEMVAAVSGRRGKLYLKRQQLIEIGPPAHEYLTEITHRRPRAWTGEIERLHDLLQGHSPGALGRAFCHAIDQGTFGAEYVAHYLETLPRNGDHA
jgi:transposase